MKIISSVQIRIAKKLKHVAVKLIGAGLGNYVDVPSGIATIFRIEIAGQDTELGNSIEVGNNSRSSVDILFSVAPVHNEGIREFPLPVDRSRSRIQVARR